MEEELKNLIKVWVSATISLSYCYYLGPRIKSGFPKLIFFLPVCALFFVLPLFLSYTIFTDTTAFFLTLLANLKLILFCFDQGPLFPLPSNLIQFICLACFPIKLQQNPKSQNQQNPRTENHFSKRGFATKVAIYGALSYLYSYKQNLPPIFLLMGFYPLLYYLELEMSLAFTKAVLSITLGWDLEPQFDEPYLATSLQDYWSRRWNLMVPAIFRPSVYNPVRQACNKLQMNPDWARFMGFFATFLVSGLFHELLYFYITRETPTWEVTMFFVVNGVCTGAEIALKRTASMQRLWSVRPAVSRLLTMVFLVTTGNCLYFAQLIRNDVMEKSSDETLLLFEFLQRKFPVF